MIRLSLAVAAASALVLTAPLQAADPVPMTIDDLNKLADVTEPVFAPDGDAVAYTLTVRDTDLDRSVSDIWIVPWKGGTPRRLTRPGKSSEWRPLFSTDGRQLFHLGDGGKKEETQLWRASATGQGAREITSVTGGISDYDISPDGKRAVVVAEVGGRVGADPDKTAPPIVIDRFFFKEDGRDYLDDRRTQLFVVDIATGKATQITNDRNDHWAPAWSPDGASIAFVAKETGDKDRTYNYDVHVIPAEGGAARQISTFAGQDANPDWGARPSWSPDSKRLLWLEGGDDKWIYYAPHQLAVADIATGAVTRPGRIDRWTYFPRWSKDGRTILAMIEQDRDTWLARIDPATDKVDYLTAGPRFGYDFAEAADGRIAVLEGTTERPYELRTLEAESRALTAHNDWLADRRLAQTRDISFRSGDAEIHGLLALPVDHVEGRRYPLIVRIHGGPVWQFNHEFHDDMQVLAARGYAVLAVNPRGSSGRGFDFARAIYADWGNVDVKDVKAGIDHAIALGIADPDRIGVGGWSYGGILTNYMIASDNRIKAAVSGAGAANFIGTFGADMYMREYELELGSPWENFDTWRKLSYPFLHADRITTPTLYQCAQSDFNVPCIGAEQMYMALKFRNVPTGLVIYPGENHGLTVPSYLTDRMTRIVGWYDRWLMGM